MDKIIAKILGKINLLQSTIHIMQNDRELAHFVCRGFSGIPSMESVGIFVGGEYYSENGKLFIQEEECKQLFNCLSNYKLHQNERLRSLSDFEAKHKIKCLKINTGIDLYGFLFITTDAPGIFSDIQPYIENTLNLIALVIENNLQKKLLHDSKDDLEKQVAERTSELIAINQKLADEIEERKQAEEKLKKSEALYHDLVETSQDLIWQCDAEGRYTYLNPAFEQVFGYKIEEMIGKKFSDFQSTVISERDQQEFVRLMQGNSVKGYETIHIGKAGNEIHLVFNAKLLTDENGNAAGTRGTAYDITERKRVENNLDESRRFLTDIIENSGALIFVKSSEGRYEMVNRKWEEVTGLMRRVVLGRTDEELFPGPIGQQFRLNDLEVMEAGVLREKEEILEDAHGKRFFISIKFPVWNMDGTIRGICGMTTEITERIRAENERQRLRYQLTQAQKMESVGRLAGGVAHDFNNMLMAIIGNAGIALEETDPSKPVYANLQEIISAAERSADLTRQLLAFARKQTISPKVMDLNDSISGMIKMIQRLIGEDIDLVWKPAMDLWPVKIDPSQIDQILVNLAVNARDAIAGVGNLMIETRNVVFDETVLITHADLFPGNYVMLAVSDTGCGMEKEIQEHLFEPFYTTKEIGKGTGLGLATIYGIVRQNNGCINVYSEPGQGTTFKIYLPRTQTGGAEETREARQKPARGTETVLIVEDELPILSLGKKILERYGYTVLDARSPEEAESLAEQHQGPIHLLITDVVMPKMNGRDLMKRLIAIRPELKTLFMSGYTADIIAHHGVIDKGICFLQKPFSVQALAGRVREMLDDPTDS